MNKIENNILVLTIFLSQIEQYVPTRILSQLNDTKDKN